MDIDPQWAEIFGDDYRQPVSASDGSANASPESPSSFVEERLAVALEVVSEAAAAMKGSEHHAAEMVARAEALADQAIEKLRAAEARTEHARAEQRATEDKAAALAEALANTRHELEEARTRLATREVEVATAQERASLAERRAGDAETALERLIDAVHTEFARSTTRDTANKASAMT